VLCDVYLSPSPAAAGCFVVHNCFIALQSANFLCSLHPAYPFLLLVAIYITAFVANSNMSFLGQVSTIKELISMVDSGASKSAT
jgi:hypothetical protein